jgi:alpha-tubulin suppressor-like RCC1 family protein
VKRRIFLISLVMVGLTAAFNACNSAKFITSRITTSVGNPKNPAPVATDLMASLCGTVSRCHSNANYSKCQSAVMTLGINRQLGLPASGYPTYSSIVDAERRGVLIGNQNSANVCSLTIDGLACSSPEVQGAYDPAAPNSFSGVAQMIPIQASSLCTQVFAPLGTSVVKVTRGAYHACAITQSGGAYCWGANTHGELGNNSNLPSIVPVPVVGLSSGVQEIAAGNGQTCAIVNGGALCWGDGRNGGLGNGGTADRLIPTPVTGLDSGVTAISANLGGGVVCAIQNGSALCWGYALNGTLGNNSTVSSSVPVQVLGLTSGVQTISTGSDHVCASTSAGVKCWGLNFYQQLGAASTDTCYGGPCSKTPISVTGFSGPVQSVAAGFNHTCALSNGSVQCWGSINGSMSPLQVPTLVSNVQAISRGDNYSCALLMDQTLECWGGNNTVGQFGNNLQTASPTPVPVLNLSGVLQFSADQFGSCAVTSSGVWCWGLNTAGEGGATSTSACGPNGPCNLVAVPVTGFP